MKTLQVFIDGDTNIPDWWNNILKPAFEAVHSGRSFNVTITRGVADGSNNIAGRVLAAMQTKTDPQVDYFEEIEPASATGTVEAGLWLAMDEKNVPNLKMINPAAVETAIRLPYRGSQVLIAYDSAEVANPPKTFADLVAWAKANPGRFSYGRPDKGGSGSNFVIRALHEANGRNPAAFAAANFDPAKAEEMLQKGWAILKDLHPVTFGEGTCPAGNTSALQLLAEGAVDMIPAWSDQALQAMKNGVLPETVKVVQMQDLALCGGFAYSAILANATDLEGALALANFMLSPESQTSCVRDIGGFPGITWDSLPVDLKAEYLDVIPVSNPTFPSGDWQTAKNCPVVAYDRRAECWLWAAGVRPAKGRDCGEGGVCVGPCGVVNLWQASACRIVRRAGAAGRACAVSGGGAQGAADGRDFSALDAHLRKALREELKSLQRRLGLSTIFVTHDQEEAMELAGRIVVMQAGRVKQIGPPGSLYRTPQTLNVAQFIGVMNICTTGVQASVALWYGRGLRLAMTDGEAVLLCRPEDLYPDAKGALAQVTRVIDLGPVTRVNLMTTEADLLSWTCPREAVAAAGDAVRLLPRRLHVFRHGTLLGQCEQPKPANLEGVLR